MAVIPLAGVTPVLGSGVFVAPDAWVIGRSTIGSEVSIFFGAVLRGDIEPIIVGDRTNIQEHALLHTSRGGPPCTVGSGCTIGHHAVIHGCTVGNNTLIGMNAVILDRAEIGDDSVVGAHTLVPQGKKFPPRSMILGSPGKVVRELTDEEVEFNRRSASGYVATGGEYITYFESVGGAKGGPD